MFYKGEIPFVRLLIPLVIGIFAAFLRPSTTLFNLAFFAAMASLALLFFLIGFYKQYNLYRFRWLIGFVVHCFFILAGYYLTVKGAEKYDRMYFTNFSARALIVTIRNEPQQSGDILRFETSVDEVLSTKDRRPAKGKLLVALKTDSGNTISLSYGDQLLIPSRYNEVDPPFNPEEFDFKNYLAGKKIYRQTFINQQQVSVLGHNRANSLILAALNLRKKLVSKFYRYLHDEDAAALASALILGYRSNLSKDVLSAYSKTGTMHVLSVSGMHVGIVFIVLNFLLRPLRKSRNLRYLSALLIIGSIWFYALITGFSPSVCRAALMLSFVVLGKTLSKSRNTYNLLAISAFFLLIYNPFNLLDVGFQLSYLAVTGLVYLHPKIYHSLNLKNRFADSVWNYSALSISAQLATFPISLYYFHQFPVYFLISNLLVVLPVALIMYAGILFLLIPWPSILIGLGGFLNLIITYTNKILAIIEHLPLASLGGVWISTPQYLLIYVILGLLMWAILSRKKLAVYLAALSIFLLSASISAESIRNRNRKELIFYSLRKNAAIAFVHRQNSYLLTDLEDQDKTISFSIKPALERRGISRMSDIKLDSSFSNPDVKILPGYMQFGNFKVFRWNKDIDNLIFGRKLRADVILLSGNAKVSIRQLKDNTEFSMLLIDATNFDYRIKQWKTEAESLKIPVRVLKKSPAYVIKF